MLQFTARAVTAEEIEGAVFIVALAEGEDGDGVHLLLQRANTFDDDDRRSGMDTYCLSTEDGATHYGGVASWTISQNRLELRLTDRAAGVLGVEGFLIAFPPERAALLRVGLQRVLDG